MSCGPWVLDASPVVAESIEDCPPVELAVAVVCAALVVTAEDAAELCVTSVLGPTCVGPIALPVDVVTLVSPDGGAFELEPELPLGVSDGPTPTLLVTPESVAGVE